MPDVDKVDDPIQGKLNIVFGVLLEGGQGTLLDVDHGASTNRTVYTLVGAPEAVVDGALAAAEALAKSPANPPGPTGAAIEAFDKAMKLPR